jgi:hypothetical protein
MCGELAAHRAGIAAKVRGETPAFSASGAKRQVIITVVFYIYMRVRVRVCNTGVQALRVRQ